MPSWPFTPLTTTDRMLAIFRYCYVLWSFGIKIRRCELGGKLCTATIQSFTVAPHTHLECILRQRNLNVNDDVGTGGGPEAHRREARAARDCFFLDPIRGCVLPHSRR